MKIKSFYIATILVGGTMFTSCTDYEVKDPNFIPPDVVLNEEPKYNEIIEGLPEPGKMQAYKPSLIGKPYRPITVKYSSEFKPVSRWTSVDTRVVAYMADYEPTVLTESDYKSITNKYGSLTTGIRLPATGRFYVTKGTDGRWWIIDPEGYPHYERSVTSVRYGSSTRNREAWNSRFGSDENWLATSQSELASIGFHGTGAFCTDTYQKIQVHNQTHPDAPLTLAPSFGFLTQFRQQANLAYPGGISDNSLGLVLHEEEWTTFCKSYVAEVLAPYKNDANVLGFFSDNEINFSTQNSKILDRFLAITTPDDIAYKTAKAFMDEKEATKVTDNLNAEFAGRLAEIYYKGVKDAVKEFDPGMMYLGTRLHGTPKYMKNVVEAAGKYCDIVSINYYSRWSPELDTYVKDWETWANAPFLVTEFYTKGVEDSDLNNGSGAGFSVPRQEDRAYAYQHFTLGLLEAKNCVGWHWFKYQDDDGNDNTGKPANKGVYDNYYQMYPYLSKFMQEVNYNVYNLIDFFDN
ncbi:hypothetical protein [Bacteroides clarus]